MGRKKHTSEDISEWLRGTGIRLVGEYTNALTKTIFECSFGHQWEARPNKIKYGRGCPICNGGSNNKSLNEEQLIKHLKSCGDEISLVGTYVNAHKNTLFRCKNNHFWNAKPYSIKNLGSGCPECADHSGGGFNPSKPAWEYVFIREEYIKFGITNNLSKRLNEHRRNGEIKLVHQRHHPVGQFALEWENRVKKTYGGRFVTKEQCPDGFTETLPVHLLEEIINSNSSI
jgi:hypothetical protein